MAAHVTDETSEFESPSSTKTPIAARTITAFLMCSDASYFVVLNSFARVIQLSLTVPSSWFCATSSPRSCVIMPSMEIQMPTNSCLTDTSALRWCKKGLNRRDMHNSSSIMVSSRSPCASYGIRNKSVIREPARGMVSVFKMSHRPLSTGILEPWRSSSVSVSKDIACWRTLCAEVK